MRLALIFGFLLPLCFAQEVQVGRKYINFTFTSEVESSLSSDVAAEIDAAGKITIHRSIGDNAHRVIYGYDLVLVPRTQDTYTASFEPLQRNTKKLTGSPVPQRPAGPPGWSYQQPPEYPPVFILQVGVLSIIQLKPQIPGQEQLSDSIAVETQLALKTLRLNDSPQLFRGLGPVRGELVWFYIPLHGRYILSITPRSTLGFIKAGIIHAGKLCEFVIDGDRVEFESSAILSTVDSDSELYVLHDSDFEPTGKTQKSQVLSGTVSVKELVQLARR